MTLLWDIDHIELFSRPYVSARLPVLEAWQLLADLIYVIGVDLGVNDRLAVFGAGDRHAPRIDDHGTAVSLKRRLLADLGGSDHIALILDGAGFENAFPVILARKQRVVGGHEHHLGALKGHNAVHFGKTHVVTDRQPHFAELGIGDDDPVPRFFRVRFARGRPVLNLTSYMWIFS